MRAFALVLLVLVGCTTDGEKKGKVRLDQVEEPAAAPAASAEATAATPLAPVADPSAGMPRPPAGSDAFVMVDPKTVKLTDQVLTKGLTAGDEPVASRTAECDANFGSPLGRYWYTFADDACRHGTSVSLLQLLHTGNDGLGCTLRWFGGITTAVSDPFAGVGVNITRTDLATKNHVLIEVRGDGRTYRAQFVRKLQLDEDAKDEDCTNDNWDFYGQEFVCGDGTSSWSPVSVDLHTLKQLGFGTPVALDLSDAERFQIVTRNTTEVGFQCEFRVLGVD